MFSATRANNPLARPADNGLKQKARPRPDFPEAGPRPLTDGRNYTAKIPPMSTPPLFYFAVGRRDKSNGTEGRAGAGGLSGSDGARKVTAS